jgi:micrococcal nuclease
MKMKKGIILALVLAAATLSGVKISKTQLKNIINVKDDNLVKVVKIIDGDTIEIEGNKTVRYIGIDTPELKDERSDIACLAGKAMEKNKELLEGNSIRLEKDVSKTDKYGRLLRYVYKDDIFINELLVREGYALVSTYPPDVKYQDLFIEAEREARNNKKGIWSNICLTPSLTNF